MLLPRVEAVLNPKFGVVILKTTTCRSCTTHNMMMMIRTCMGPLDQTYMRPAHYIPTIGSNHYVGEKCKFNTKIASRFGKFTMGQKVQMSRLFIFSLNLDSFWPSSFESSTLFGWHIHIYNILFCADCFSFFPHFFYPNREAILVLKLHFSHT